MGPTDSTRRTFHRFRVEVLEQLVLLENAMDAVIAAEYARSATASTQLRVEIVSTMPLARRIKSLLGMMERYELANTYPFVVPILRKVIIVRNDMAHSLDDDTVDPGDGTIRLLGLSNGQVKPVTYSTDYLDWLFGQARQIQRELEAMYWKVAPVDPKWHEG
ncbi:MAG: hypothetical protein ABWX92_06690 [Mycetocola sp.]